MRRRDSAFAKHFPILGPHSSAAFVAPIRRATKPGEPSRVIGRAMIGGKVRASQVRKETVFLSRDPESAKGSEVRGADQSRDQRGDAETKKESVKRNTVDCLKKHAKKDNEYVTTDVP
jgi:hypothetical protein